MSSVFRIVFIAAIAGEVRLPKNLFLFVYFKRKDKLLFQSLVHTVQLLAEFVFYSYYNTKSKAKLCVFRVIAGFAVNDRAGGLLAARPALNFTGFQL